MGETNMETSGYSNLGSLCSEYQWEIELDVGTHIPWSCEESDRNV